MNRRRPTLPSRRAARRLALALALPFCTAATGNAQSPGGSAAPRPVSPEEFASLGWLEGTWRGRLPDGGSFFERYARINDSTISVTSFPDSSLSTSRDIGSVALRAGALFRLEATGERVPVSRLDASGLVFGTSARGFTWAPGPDGSWTATIHRTTSTGEPRETVYRLEPYGPGGDDRSAVHAAVLDYVDALYEVDPSRVERSVHPELAKRGFARRGAGDGYDELKMSYAELHALAGRWNRSGRVDPRRAVKEIEVFDVLDQTAAAKLTAQWGTDYLHLAKYDGRWQIVNVLWQSPPPAPPIR